MTEVITMFHYLISHLSILYLRWYIPRGKNGAERKSPEGDFLRLLFLPASQLFYCLSSETRQNTELREPGLKRECL